MYSIDRHPLVGFSQAESDFQKSVMQAKLSALEEQAYALAQHPFSLSSSEDVAQVFSIDMQLPTFCIRPFSLSLCVCVCVCVCVCAHIQVQVDLCLLSIVLTAGALLRAEASPIRQPHCTQPSSQNPGSYQARQRSQQGHLQHRQGCSRQAERPACPARGDFGVAPHQCCHLQGGVPAAKGEGVQPAPGHGTHTRHCATAHRYGKGDYAGAKLAECAQGL